VSQGSGGPESAAEAPPLLAVVRGQPTVAELAALTVVINALARRGSQHPAAKATRSQWAARERMLRPPLAAGPGAWRASALPNR
jgi:hypothetical protein